MASKPFKTVEPKAPSVKKTEHNKKYSVAMGNGYPVEDNKLNKPTVQRGYGAAKKGYTSHGPMG
jgi:hypothetical protein